MSQNSIYLHGLKKYPAFGSARISRLCAFFKNDFAKAFWASKQEMSKAGVEDEHAREWEQIRETLDIKKEQSTLNELGIELLTFTDPSYPKLLLEIPDFPPLLYTRGKAPGKEEVCLAVVGTRKISTYGRIVTPELVGPLCLSGVTIVSGMAFGVDALAHETAIQNNGRTIAVLGGGLDDKSLYPQNHQLLAKKILDSGGGLVSEYPPGTPALRHHFISRNRIISGLSVGCLVVECSLKSGSLITAKHALEQNRSVFAVPGPIYSENSTGPNNLLKMGARAVTESKDISEELNLAFLPEQIQTQDLFGMTADETRMLELVSSEPKHTDELIKLSDLPASRATSALTFLEMKGKVRNVGGQQYVRSR